MIDSSRKPDGAHPVRVTAVIPCYNGRTHIADAVRSVLAQTFGDLEVVVVDDGSSDGSRDVVRAIADPRVRLVEHGANRGIAAARNTGVREARGEYVAFLDQDDAWYPHKLRRQVEILDGEGAGDIALVFTAREIARSGRRYRVARDRRFPRPIEKASRREVLAAFLDANFVWLISALVRRGCFDDVGFFDESIRSGADDFDFCVRVAMKYRLAYIDEVLVLRHEHGKNYTDPTRMLADDLDVVGRIARFDSSLEDLARRRRSDLYFRSGRWWQDRGERAKAREAFRESLRLCPGKWKAAGALGLAALGPAGGALVRLYNTVRYGRSGG